MFVYVTTEQFVPKHHPRRSLKPLVDSALSKLDREFDTLYASTGRPSIPPEYLLRGLVLQFLYSIRVIQNLLGHSSLKTTMIYTHCVPVRTIKEARSPLDLD